MLPDEVCKLSCVTYGERLDSAIKMANSTRKRAAVAAGLTERAIGQCIRGETTALKVDGSARVAAFLMPGPGIRVENIFARK